MIGRRINIAHEVNLHHRDHRVRHVVHIRSIYCQSVVVILLLKQLALYGIDKALKDLRKQSQVTLRYDEVALE